MQHEELYSKAYKDRLHEPVIVLRDAVYTRNDMVMRLKIAHTNAAVRTNHIFDELNIDTVERILEIPMMDLARVRGVGETCIRVIIEILIDQGVGVRRITRWINDSLNGEPLVQWSSIVARAARHARKHGHVVLHSRR